MNADDGLGQSADIPLIRGLQWFILFNPRSSAFIRGRFALLYFIWVICGLRTSFAGAI